MPWSKKVAGGALACACVLGPASAWAQTLPVNIPANANHWDGSYVGQVQVALVAGDYTLLYRGLSDNQPGEAPQYLYDAWSCCGGGGGFINQYFVQTSAGTRYSGTVVSGSWAQFATATEALHVAKTTLTPIVLHLLQAEVVRFGVADAPGTYGDNGGGISLLISAVPEPSSVAYLLSGLGWVAWAARKRRRA
jgi:hypothetical protein